MFEKRMYRRPKFLEELDEIRKKMSREANFDVEIFTELIQMANGGSPAPLKHPPVKTRRKKTAVIKRVKRANLPEQEVGK